MAPGLVEWLNNGSTLNGFLLRLSQSPHQSVKLATANTYLHLSSTAKAGRKRKGLSLHI